MLNLPNVIDSEYIRDHFQWEDGKRINIHESTTLIRAVKGPSKTFGRTITKSPESFLAFLAASSLKPKVETVEIEEESVEN